MGAFSGYVGGLTDNLIMRWSEIEMSLPSFYFLLALAAVIPSGMSPVDDVFHDRRDHELHQLGRLRADHPRDGGLGAIAPLRRGGARAGRLALAGAFLATSCPRCSATRSSRRRFRFPGFILGESALSLLGLGIQEPAASWGNLLAQAEDVQNLAHYPWILIPGIFIFLTVMSFNFLGDHLRDRLDPGNLR